MVTNKSADRDCAPVDADTKAKNSGENSALNAAPNQPIIALPVPGDLESIPSHPPGGARLSLERARQLTDSIRIDAQGVRAMLLRAYEGSAHTVLGYANFGEYCVAEFSMRSRNAYRSLAAARVEETLGDKLVTDAGSPNESVARELIPLLDDPDEMRATYTEAAETAPRDAGGEPKVTAAHVRETMDRREEQSAEPSPREVSEPSNPSRTQATVSDAISHVVTVIRDGEPADDIHGAITAALRVLSRRRMGTPPGILADCVASLLGSMTAMVRGSQ